MGSAPHSEEAYDMYVWVQNDLYIYLLQHPYETINMYETKDKDSLNNLIKIFIDKVPLHTYNRDYAHDWIITESFIDSLRAAYKSSKALLSKSYF